MQNVSCFVVLFFLNTLKISLFKFHVKPTTTLDEGDQQPSRYELKVNLERL